VLAPGHPGAAPWIVGACAGLLCITSMAAWPLMAFKRQQRLSMVDAAGLRTTIGNKTGTLSWRDVQSIERATGYVHIVRHDLNTFVVARCAFESDTGLEEFVRVTREWLATGR
jgi:hypothetical protein